MKAPELDEKRSENRGKPGTAPEPVGKNRKEKDLLNAFEQQFCIWQKTRK